MTYFSDRRSAVHCVKKDWSELKGRKIPKIFNASYRVGVARRQSSGHFLSTRDFSTSTYVAENKNESGQYHLA